MSSFVLALCYNEQAIGMPVNCVSSSASIEFETDQDGNIKAKTAVPKLATLTILSTNGVFSVVFGCVCLIQTYTTNTHNNLRIGPTSNSIDEPESCPYWLCYSKSVWTLWISNCRKAAENDCMENLGLAVI